MLIQIPNVLSLEEEAQARKELDATNWVDGKVTAGFQSAQVKQNMQLPESNPVGIELGRKIVYALYRNALFFAAALPAKIFPPLFNRYDGGHSFGNHVDNAVRRVTASGEQIRTDLSMTLFLSSPEEYDGGELIIEDTYGSHSVKLPAGHMVLYPSSSLHRVTPVTRGSRISSFFWLQSMIRQDGQRAILFDLDATIQSISESDDNEAVRAASVRLTGVYHNLLRQWSEL